MNNITEDALNMRSTSSSDEGISPKLDDLFCQHCGKEQLTEDEWIRYEAFQEAEHQMGGCNGYEYGEDPYCVCCEHGQPSEHECEECLREDMFYV